ncbi:hypothetical protein AAHC03_019319 [Spirometra sp. Aus1]|nr:unnamed protein product [Spirometra erinaceieuropaei]
MEKIINGILKFRTDKRASVLEKLAFFKRTKHPNAIVISCMDARVYPTRFTASESGDLYTVRNAGNFIPHAQEFADRKLPISNEPGALELACCRSGVKDIIICGHSDCKAMNLLMKVGEDSAINLTRYSSPLERWVVQMGKSSLEAFLRSDALTITFDLGSDFRPMNATVDAERRFSPVDRLSQVNVLQQMANVYSHPILKDAIALGNVRVLGMWYNISTADVYLYSWLRRKFVLVDESSSHRLLEEYGS